MDTRPRPLKVVLQDDIERLRVLKRTYRLKGEPFRELRDLSPEDRIKMRNAVEELKSRRAKGETNLHIMDFQVIRRVHRVHWEPVVLLPNR